VSARAVRGFLVLKPMYQNLNRLALLLTQLGLMMFIIGVFFDLEQSVASSGLILLAIGTLTFVYALRVLEPGNGSVRRFSVGYARYDWLIRMAYVWLVFGSVLLVFSSLDDAGFIDLLPSKISLPVMHVLTLGFVSTLIFGAGSRFIPIFEGSDIRYPRLMDAASIAITVSVVLRVSFGFSTSVVGEQALGASGGIGMIGIILFSIVIFHAMTSSARAAYTKRASAFGHVNFNSVESPSNVLSTKNQIINKPLKLK
jgi:hypothetical protein